MSFSSGSISHTRPESTAIAKHHLPFTHFVYPFPFLTETQLHHPLHLHILIIPIFFLHSLRIFWARNISYHLKINEFWIELYPPGSNSKGTKKESSKNSFSSLCSQRSRPIQDGGSSVSYGMPHGHLMPTRKDTGITCLSLFPLTHTAGHHTHELHFGFSPSTFDTVPHQCSHSFLWLHNIPCGVPEGITFHAIWAPGGTRHPGCSHQCCLLYYL